MCALAFKIVTEIQREYRSPKGTLSPAHKKLTLWYKLSFHGKVPQTAGGLNPGGVFLNHKALWRQVVRKGWSDCCVHSTHLQGPAGCSQQQEG